MCQGQRRRAGESGYHHQALSRPRDRGRLCRLIGSAAGPTSWRGHESDQPGRYLHFHLHPHPHPHPVLHTLSPTPTLTQGTVVAPTPTPTSTCPPRGDDLWSDAEDACRTGCRRNAQRCPTVCCDLLDRGGRCGRRANEATMNAVCEAMAENNVIPSLQPSACCRGCGGCIDG